MEITFSDFVDDTTLAAGDFTFSGFLDVDSNGSGASVSTGAFANDETVIVTLFGEMLAPYAPGDVAFSAPGVVDGTDGFTSSQTTTIGIDDEVNPAPTVTFAITNDSDANGQIDRVTVYFDQAVDIADGNASDGLDDFIVAGYTIAAADYAATDAGNVVLLLEESGTPDTDATPTVSLTNTGSIRDSDTRAMVEDEAGLVASDGARPAIVFVESDWGSNEITVTLSEPTYTDISGTSTLAITDFGYSNASADGVSAMVAMLDSDASDEVVTIQLDANLIVSDFRTDTLRFLPSGVYDLVLNVGQTNQVELYDTGDPVLLSGTTVDIDDDGSIDGLRLVFDEPILDSSVVASDFDVAGVTGEAFSSTTAGDVADDLVIFITFDDGILDTGAEPDVTYTKGTFVDRATPANDLETTTLTGGAGITDDADPLVLAAITDDADENGQIDAITVTLSETVTGTAELADWTVAGYTVSGVAYGTASATLSLTESGSPDTDATPAVTYTDQGAVVQDGVGLDLVDATVTASDGAEPVLLSATTQVGLSQIVVTWSEPVGSMTDGTGVLEVADLVYADVSTSDATSIASLSDDDATNEVAILAMDVAIGSADLTAPDTLTAAASSVYDAAGLASLGTVDITGGTGVLDVTSITVDGTITGTGVLSMTADAVALPITAGPPDTWSVTRALPDMDTVTVTIEATDDDGTRTYTVTIEQTDVPVGGG